MLLAAAAVLVLSFSLDCSSVDGEEQDDSDVSPDDDDNDDLPWFEIDDITYIPISTDEVMANQCFQEVADVVVPPIVVHDDVSYKVTKLSSNFICTDIEALTIPYTVIDIDEVFFCTTLKAIIVEENNPEYASMDGVLYSKGWSLLIRYPIAKEGERFMVPSGVSGLADYCFMHNENLREVYLPNRIYCIPLNAFEGCTNLYHVNFDGERNKLPESVRMIDECAFERCTSLQQLDMPSNLIYIGSFAFNSSGLSSFMVPSSVDFIGLGAFSGCSNLHAIDSDSQSYRSVDGVLFENIGMDVVLHTYPDRLDEVYVMPEDTTKIEGLAFKGMTHLKEVVISPNIPVLSSNSFAYCDSLEKVEIPGSVYKIEDMAFYGCQNLKEVILGDGLIRIGYFAFRECDMEAIDIPSSVKYLDGSTFSGCKSLRVVNIYSEQVTMGDSLFEMCPSLEEINIYGEEITFHDATFLAIYSESTVVIQVQKGVEFNQSYLEDNVVVKTFGERPYPYENFIGVFVCVLVVLIILRTFRGV